MDPVLSRTKTASMALGQSALIVTVSVWLILTPDSLEKTIDTSRVALDGDGDVL
jgi:hypothetical protein